ncbi:MAG: hypothetical protein HUJ68_13785, partial [Clostridia bacterium]|nr:hypothetical protein [Clostridia bacterium]
MKINEKQLTKIIKQCIRENKINDETEDVMDDAHYIHCTDNHFEKTFYEVNRNAYDLHGYFESFVEWADKDNYNNVSALMKKWEGKTEDLLSLIKDLNKEFQKDLKEIG